MSHNVNAGCLLVGSGQIAAEYARVLQAQGVPFTVVGRTEASAKKFLGKTGIHPVTGGLESYLETGCPRFRSGIIAVNIEELAGCTRLLIEHGIPGILVEKPGALSARELEPLALLAGQQHTDVFIAYNRRFHASTLKAREYIREDGGITSFAFEFTEWSHEIEPLPAPKAVKERWLIANSTHVIDLAFFLGGEPERINCFTSGALSWHSAASAFSGAGTSKSGALFSYQANWDAPGRWGVEVSTRHHRLIFRPLEQLHIQRRGSTAIEKCEIDDSLDLSFKPGFYRQVQAFLDRETGALMSLAGQLERMKIYQRIGGYPEE
jgi:predicted dehydrogenase